MKWLGVLLVLAGCPNNNPTADKGCISCHAKIEPVHDPVIPGDSCVSCHGGDGRARKKEDAHPQVPENWSEIRGSALPPAAPGYIRDFSPDQLDQLDPAYLQFVNPGDIRVLDETCGKCHADKVATVRNSIMTTNAGHYMPTRFLGGFQDRNADFGTYPATDDTCDPELDGNVCSMVPLRPGGEDVIADTLENGTVAALEELAFDHYLSKRCDTCHAAGFGKNNARHLYRSTGCTACHMIYTADGLYEGADEALAQNLDPHSATHEITKDIPTEQCATCHFQGGRIGLLYRGIREAGFAERPPNAVAWEPGAYGRGDPFFYLEDEDSTNPIDESPPDLHYAAGMQCGDCHVGSDVHGDGKLWSTAKQQVDIACEDCHGGIRESASPDGEGVFRTANGRELPQLKMESGSVTLTRLDGVKMSVPQPAELLPSGSVAMHAAMGEDENGWSHTDSLTCDTCHTSYNLFCLGCHVQVDFSGEQIDHQTGLATPGVVAGNRQTWSLDHLLLGVRGDGRVQTVNPSQQVQLTVRDFDGELVIGDPNPDTSDPSLPDTLGEFRVRPGVDHSLGFAPFFQHTTSRAPRDCTACHRADATPEELQRVRGVYGHGTGEFMLPSPSGEVIDSLQFLAPDGTSLMDWVHTDSGPVPPERRQRALDVILSESP